MGLQGNQPTEMSTLLQHFLKQMRHTLAILDINWLENQLCSVCPTVTGHDRQDVMVRETTSTILICALHTKI